MSLASSEDKLRVISISGGDLLVEGTGAGGSLRLAPCCS